MARTRKTHKHKDSENKESSEDQKMQTENTISSDDGNERQECNSYASKPNLFSIYEKRDNHRQRRKALYAIAGVLVGVLVACIIVVCFLLYAQAQESDNDSATAEVVDIQTDKNAKALAEAANSGYEQSPFAMLDESNLLSNGEQAISSTEEVTVEDNSSDDSEINDGDDNESSTDSDDSSSETHKHHWVTNYVTEKTAEEYHIVHHSDKYELQTAYHTVCNTCLEIIDGQTKEHAKKTGHTGYTTNVPVEEAVLVEGAYDEKVIDQAAGQKVVANGEICSDCGKTRNTK